jgi:hypothetical protein
MFYRQQMTKYTNRKRIEGLTLKGGDKVYLLRRNIKSNKLTKKLDTVKLGPFKILRQKGPVNYELELPKKIRTLPTFHVSLLEPATPDARLKQDIKDISEEIQEPVYEVEKILDSKLEDGQRKYLVKWTEYDSTENTWEPRSSFNSQKPIDDFHRTQKRGAQGREGQSQPRPEN